MDRKKKATPGESRRWWEPLGGLAGAALAVAAVVGGIYQFFLPHRSVTISVVERSWNPRGQNTTTDEKNRWVLVDATSAKWVNLECLPARYVYEFKLEVRNTGNRPIAMDEKEHKPVYVCANTPRRPGVPPPSIDVLTQTTETGKVHVDSLLNNLLQVSIRELPLFGRSIICVRLLSPIEDLGGVNLVSEDPLITVEPSGPGSSLANESFLSNNLLPAGSPLATPMTWRLHQTGSEKITD